HRQGRAGADLERGFRDPGPDRHPVPGLQATAGALGLAVRPLAGRALPGQGSARVGLVPAVADAVPGAVQPGSAGRQRVVADVLLVLGEPDRLGRGGRARLRRGGGTAGYWTVKKTHHKDTKSTKKNQAIKE